MNKKFATQKGTGINPENQQLAEELKKTVLRKFLKSKLYSFFNDNICGADLAEIQLISRYDKGN